MTLRAPLPVAVTLLACASHAGITQQELEEYLHSSFSVAEKPEPRAIPSGNKHRSARNKITRPLLQL